MSLVRVAEEENVSASKGLAPYPQPLGYQDQC